MSYYGVDEMGGGKREDFPVRYETRKSEPFDNRHVLEAYCQEDVMVLRKAFRLFRREFLQIGNIEVSLETMTIVYACNKIVFE